MAPRAAKVEIPVEVNKVVAQYLAVRERIAEIKAAQKEYLAQYDAMLDKLGGKMLAFLDATGQESAKTDEGTVFIAHRSTASLADPDAFMDYVRENDAYELMDRRANSVACREFADEHGSLPPGVKLNSTRTVNVRSPTK
jgi:hypothetical protein